MSAALAVRAGVGNGSRGRSALPDVAVPQGGAHPDLFPGRENVPVYLVAEFEGEAKEWGLVLRVECRCLFVVGTVNGAEERGEINEAVARDLGRWVFGGQRGGRR